MHIGSCSTLILWNMLEIAEISMATHFRMIHSAGNVSLPLITNRQHWKTTHVVIIIVVVSACWFRLLLLLRVSRRGRWRRLLIELLGLGLRRLKNIRSCVISYRGRCYVLWLSGLSWWFQFSLWYISGFIRLVLLIHHTAWWCRRELWLWTSITTATKDLLLLLLLGWIVTAIIVAIVGLEGFSRIEISS